MSNIQVHRADIETVYIRFAYENFGLGFDELEDEYEDRGLHVGCVQTIELTLTPDIARQLRDALNQELLSEGGTS
jgi:hypothetical protein